MTSDRSMNNGVSSGQLSCNPLMLGSLILALTKSTSKIEIFNAVVTYLPRLIYADRASVVLLESDSKQARVYSLQGETDVLPIGFPLTLEGTSVGRAIATGKLNIEKTDINSSLFDKSKLALDGFDIFINAPLIVSDRVLGSINVASRIPDLYDAQAGEILMQVAALIAVQLERQELFQATHHAMESYRIQAERLEVLNDIGRQLSSALVEEDVFRWTAKAVAKILPANRVSFAVPTEDGRHLEVIGLTGNTVIPKGALVPIEGTSVGKTFKTGQSIVIPCLRQSQSPEHQILAKSGLEVGWSVPVHIGEKIDGVLNIASTEVLSDPEELLQFLNPLARFLGVTLTRIKAQDETATALRQKKTEMEYQAHHDAL
nr:GAF domain-containing protein [Crocosphaera sp.]